MSDVPTSYYGTDIYARFQQMNADVFKIEAQAKALGFEEVRISLYRARLALGQQEVYERGQYRRAVEAQQAADEAGVSDQSDRMDGQGEQRNG